MIFQNESTGDMIEILPYVILGFILAIVCMLIQRQWSQNVERNSRPNVFFIDPIHYELKYLGRFENIETIYLTSQDDKQKTLWCVETELGNHTHYIIPAFGTQEDMIIWDKVRMPTVIIMIGKWIGFGSEKNTHKIWMDDVYPRDLHLYEKNAMPVQLPPNTILCKPIWTREMTREMFQDQSSIITGAMDTLNRNRQMMNIEIQKQYQAVRSYQIDIMRDTLSQNKTHWSSILTAWDAILTERTVPLSVLSRLLHIPVSKVNQAGFQHALNQGGLKSAAELAASFTESLAGISQRLGKSMVDSTILEMITQKANQNVDELDQMHQYLQTKDNVIRQQNQKLQALEEQLNQANANTTIPVD